MGYTSILHTNHTNFNSVGNNKINMNYTYYKDIAIGERKNGDISIIGHNGHHIILEGETVESVKAHIDKGNIKSI